MTGVRVGAVRCMIKWYRDGSVSPTTTDGKSGGVACKTLLSMSEN